MVTSPTKHYTYADYCAIDDGQRYEVYEGELILVPAPNFQHQTLLGELLILLSEHIKKKKLGKVLIAPFDIKFAEDTVLQPDILYVSNKRMDIFDKDRANAAPDLVIEVTSPSTGRRDYTRKKELYRKYGVPHYWIFDLQEQRSLAFELQTNAEVPAVETPFNEIFRAQPFPDLPIDIQPMLDQ